MQLEHIAIWTKQLETLRAYYVNYFQGVAGKKYHNAKKEFQSYFLNFGDGYYEFTTLDPDGNRIEVTSRMI
jgi:lactoylglutathione lyase